MSLSLSCPCGARFDIEETLAGQHIACPECQQSIKVPVPNRGGLRTSGYALVSVVLALVGMFTVVLSALAIVLGFAGLVSISRHRDQVTGTGYAVFGILLGMIFTGLTLFAITREEIFDQFRETVRASEADYSGPLEIVRPQEGFAITRPSPRWGIAKKGLDEEDEGGNKGLILLNVGKDAYIQVLAEIVEPNKTLDKCLDDFIASIRESSKTVMINHTKVPAHTTGVHVHESMRLPAVAGLEVLEAQMDLRLAGVPLTYVVQVRKKDAGASAYILSCWTHSRRFARVEPEMRKAIASFRLLKPD